jgi:hypothetical protein
MSDDGLQLDFDSVVPAGAYDGAERADANAEDPWRRAALSEIEALAASGCEFTADDVRAKVGEPDHSARWGGAFLSARRAGLIKPTGTVRPSATASRHASLVRVWIGAIS